MDDGPLLTMKRRCPHCGDTWVEVRHAEDDTWQCPSCDLEPSEKMRARLRAMVSADLRAKGLEVTGPN